MTSGRFTWMFSAVLFCLGVAGMAQCRSESSERVFRCYRVCHHLGGKTYLCSAIKEFAPEESNEPFGNPVRAVGFIARKADSLEWLFYKVNPDIYNGKIDHCQSVTKGDAFVAGKDETKCVSPFLEKLRGGLDNDRRGKRPSLAFRRDFQAAATPPENQAGTELRSSFAGNQIQERLKQIMETAKSLIEYLGSPVDVKLLSQIFASKRSLGFETVDAKENLPEPFSPLHLCNLFKFDTCSRGNVIACSSDDDCCLSRIRVSQCARPGVFDDLDKCAETIYNLLAPPQ